MISVEDFHNALSWAKNQRGVKSVTAISKENLNVIEEWVEKTDWVDFLTEEKDNRSSSTIVIKFIHPKILSFTESKQRDFIQTIAKPLESNKVAYDIINHPFAPPSFRIWGGPTIKKEDLKLLLDWIDWSFQNSFSKINSNS